MLSFYKMSSLVENYAKKCMQQHNRVRQRQRNPLTERAMQIRSMLFESDDELLKMATRLARLKAAGPGNRDLAGIQPDEGDIKNFLSDLQARRDPRMRFAGWKSRDLEAVTRTLAPAAASADISDKDRELNRAGREVRDNKVTMEPGRADAQTIYHLVTHEPDHFTGQEMSVHDLLMKLVKLGVIPAEEPQRLEKALKWLTQGSKPLFKVNTGRGTLSVDPATLPPKKVGDQAYIRRRDAREGDYVPGMAHPGERYTTSRMKSKFREIQPGEMPPLVRQEIDKIQSAITDLENMIERAYTHEFADMNEFSDKLEQAVSLAREALKSSWVPKDIAQEIKTKLGEIRKELSSPEMKTMFSAANPLVSAKEALRQVRIAMMSQDPDIGRTDDALRAAAATMEELMTHPKANQDPGTAQEIQKLKQELDQAKAQWEERMNPKPAPAPTPAPVAATPTPTAAPPAKKKVSLGGRVSGKTIRPAIKPSTDDLF